MAIAVTLVNEVPRVVTKVVNGVRRVSCSCCEGEAGECCPYPAQAVTDGLILSADLPDAVEVFDGTNTYTYTKSGVNFVLEDQSLRPVGSRWAGFLEENEVGDRSQPCLIAPEDTLRVTDFFEDTYKVEVFDSGNAFVYGDTYTRESLCVWSGLEENSALVFTDKATNSFLFGWGASLFESAGSKDGFQNTPEGEYSIEIGQFEGGKLVVSVP